MFVSSVILVLFISSVAPSSSDSPDIKVYVYSILNPDGVLVDLSDPSQVGESPFSFEKDSFFFIHGWLDHVQEFPSEAQLLKYFLLVNHDVNVFLVDWTSVTKGFWYPGIVDKAEQVGNTLGSLIWSLVENNGLNLDKTTLMGQSLGAHVAGVAGQVLNGEIGQAIGFDPSGPWFSLTRTTNRLTTSSAKFVQVMHTCAGLLGFADPLGHVDYYPNGGKHQPACGSDPLGKCSQEMSIAYYYESLISGKFKAKKCDSYDDYKKGSCDDGHESLMGGYQLDKEASGTYYLDTNKFPPFAKN